MITYGYDLEQFSLCNGYKGVFALDKLPYRCKRPYSFIFNTDYANEPGQHWLAIYAPARSTKIVFIDPMGLHLHELVPEIRRYLLLHAKYVETIPYPIQSFYSNSCGIFCSFIVTKLPLYDNSLQKLITYEFSEDNLVFNENRVLAWWHFFE